MRGVIETIPVRTPKTDSRSNGRAERAVPKAQKKTRVLTLGTVRNSAVEIAVSHLTFPWLVEHAVDVLNRTDVCQDGKIPWERLKIRVHSDVMYEFGT